MQTLDHCITADEAVTEYWRLKGVPYSAAARTAQGHFFGGYYVQNYIEMNSCNDFEEGSFACPYEPLSSGSDCHTSSTECCVKTVNGRPEGFVGGGHLVFSGRNSHFSSSDCKTFSPPTTSSSGGSTGHTSLSASSIGATVRSTQHAETDAHADLNSVHREDQHIYLLTASASACALLAAIAVIAYRRRMAFSGDASTSIDTQIEVAAPPANAAAVMTNNPMNTAVML
jgi:hypothetical protein